MEAQKIVHCIDWLQYSVAWPDAITEWPIFAEEELAILKTCIPAITVQGLPPERPKSDKMVGMQGYTKSFDMLYATAHVNPNFRSQKIGVRMSGNDLSAYRDLGGTEERLLGFIRGTKAKASRIDIAFDLFNFDVDLMRIYADWKAGRVKTKARTVQPFTKATRNKDGTITEATTLYFGSRTSEVMVRMYDKGAETGTDLDWLRVELEIKGDRAVAIADDCYHQGVSEVGRKLLQEFITAAPYLFWRKLIATPTAELTRVSRRLSDRQAWLLNVVIPLLREEIQHEWDSAEETGITREVEAALRQQWLNRRDRLAIAQ